MKKKILFAGMAVVVISIVTFHLHSSGEEDLRSLMLENIEALATGETEYIRCWGTGSVDCPITHVKVKLVMKN